MSDCFLHVRTSDPEGLRANGLWITTVSHNMLDSQPVFRCTTGHVPGQGMGGICNVKSRHRRNILDASYSLYEAIVI